MKIRILNGRASHTSPKKAAALINRGIAAWHEPGASITILPHSQAIAVQQQFDSDSTYWRNIASQRRGSDVVFHWHPSKSNGFNVMGAEIRGIAK